MIIIGLVILLAAVIVGVAGVLSNSGSGHPLTHEFAAFGYHVTGSTGTLFLAGIVIGAAGVAGLGLLLAGARRTSRRGTAARRGLRQSRRETAAVSQDRDDLIGQRDTARAYATSNLGSGAPRSDPQSSRAGGRWDRLRVFGRRAAPRQPASDGEPVTSQLVPDVPAGAPVPVEQLTDRSRP